MKTTIKFFILFILLNVSTWIAPQQAKAQASVSFQIFYDDLSPYGQWIDYPSYGYVWVPTFNPLFVPYSTGGHWAYTIYGWTWVSDYHWGWAPFHYGRWDYDDYYGWFWLPGNEWGPAWVLWRTSPGYYGWAPLGPNISINLAFGGGYNVPSDHWTFVQGQYMGRNDIDTYYGPRKSNQQIINNSTVINNTYVDNSNHNTYISGPKREEVEKVSGAKFTPVVVRDNTKPGQSLKNNELEIYRPTVVKSGDNNVRPSKVADKKEVKPVSERTIQPNNQPPVQQKQNIEPAVNPKEQKAAPIENRKSPKNIGDQPKQQEQKPVQQVIPQQPRNVPQEKQQAPEKIRVQPSPPQPKVAPQEKQQAPIKAEPRSQQPLQPKQVPPAPKQEKQKKRGQPGNQESEQPDDTVGDKPTEQKQED